MAIDYNVLAAWSALTAAVIAIVALWIESRRSRFSLGIDLLLKLDHNFKTERMCTARQTVAKAYQMNKSENDIDEILDFFEMIGLLTHRGALSDILVWHNFFYWIHGYYLLSRDYIKAAQSEDPTVWQNLVSLHKRLVAIEKRERRCTDSQLQLTKEELTEFLTRHFTKRGCPQRYVAFC